MYPHVLVGFYGWFESDSHVHIAMELAEYGNLDGYLDKPKSELEAKCISVQILRALDTMHEKGLTHMDIKPKVWYIIVILVGM